ncbi:MAG: hypothetical protein JST11_17965 [Acidobacteria bacterium]|nr:hypothetical protein [Acidobacteriota bacterium]
MLLAFMASGCHQSPALKNRTIILGLTENMNTKCIGHESGLCGPERKMFPVEVAGIFATEPECEGLKLRGLTLQEGNTPSLQIPLLFDLYYEGTPHADRYYGTGKGEDEGWMLSFNGPNGHFSARVKTEAEAVRRVCLAAKGKGGRVDQDVRSIP